MKWNLYFPDYDVPKQIQEMTKYGVVIDTSSPDDSCPSFSSKLANGKVLTIRVGHSDPLKRPPSCLTRFTLVFRKGWNDHGKEVWFTNDLEDMTVEFYGIYAENGGQSGKFRLLGLGRSL
jgi:hypothetical protein